MKSIAKPSLLAAAFAVITSSATFADDQQLQNRLASARAQKAPASRTTTTVAVYAHGHGTGTGRSETQAVRTEPRFELRSSARGQTFGIFVPAK